ncbi:MAG: hypothetical protein OEZ08_10035 [Betaproteobacteria bacterium]|nr:hypothetical protein [Betaproteobacteria bacterium]
MRHTLDVIGLGRLALRALCLIAFASLSGCFGAQIHPTLHERAISLRAGDLESAGVAFITPSTATGQEEEKQAVALIFAEAMKRERPRIPVVALAETLGAINKSGLAEGYKRMYNDYRDTGLFERGILKQVGAATGSRYLAQLKLQRFSQGDKERFGALGLRIVETRFASVRLFFQIWDTRDGTIAWEGMQEMLYAEDKVAEQPVTLQTMIDRTASDLIAHLP